MQKLLQTCFLALLCLVGRYLVAQSKVVRSPGAELLHRSDSPNRGGAILPDTFFKDPNGAKISSLPLPNSGPWTVDGGPILRSPVLSTLPTGVGKYEASDIGLPPQKGFSLVDNATSQGQEETPSAQMGDESHVLIYGEIINPDSLGPLTLRATPYYLDEKSSFLKETFPITMEKGEFFDGVLNPMVKKFTIRFHVPDRASYFSLFLGDKPILENYLTWPGDSLKISLDLQSFQISFAGKNAVFYELQYLIAREVDRQVFDSPRQLVLNPNSSILTKQENIAKLKFFKTQFGSKLEVVSGGKESLQKQFSQLSDPETALETRLQYLDFFQGKLEPGLLEFIRLDLMTKYYRGVIASIRNFNLDVLEKEFSKSESDSISQKLIWELENLKGLESLEHAKLVSQGFLGMEIERQTLLAVLKGTSFLTQVESEYSGELSDRIKAGFLSKYLKQYSNPERILSTYLEGMSYDPWISRVESLKQANIPGEQFMDLSFRNLKGEKLSSSSFSGKPTLLYVYFSTCSHSADYFKDYLFPLFEETQDLGYQLIALSVDDDPELWRSRLEKFSDPSLLNLNISGKQKETFVQTYEIFGFPKVFLLDESGKITAFKIEGWDKASMKTFVLENLGISSSTQTNPKP